MYVLQQQLNNIQKYIPGNKAIIILGPRRVGKTTLLKHLTKNMKDFLLVNGEDRFIQEALSSQSISALQKFIGHHKVLIIDEAQKIPNIGLNIKLIVDNIEGVQVIATGSSAFDLAKNTGEPLTGRKITFYQFPIAQYELTQAGENFITTLEEQENRLIFGSYPEVILSKSNDEKREYLEEIVNSYLYKDILELDGIRNSEKIIKLLQLLAFQIGHEVSYTKLGTQLGMSKNTVQKYLDLLEKSFVVHRLGGFKRNLRTEISKSSRYYFYDNGIRNALIKNFNSLSLRDDAGMLWENYIISERLKKQHYTKQFSNNYFWRTHDKQEIDFVEEKDGILHGYEIKYGKKVPKIPRSWLTTYPNAQFLCINQENYLEFISV